MIIILPLSLFQPLPLHLLKFIGLSLLPSDLPLPLPLPLPLFLSPVVHLVQLLLLFLFQPLPLHLLKFLSETTVTQTLIGS